MTALQSRIIDELRYNGKYTTKGINANLPDLIEESIYTAQELGIDYFLNHTSFGHKLKQFVVKEVELLRIKKELQKNAIAGFHSDKPYTEVDDKIKTDLIRKMETLEVMR
jgi:hypothetical protein